MATDVGRVGDADQALVASDGAAKHLHPPGFDPSRCGIDIPRHKRVGVAGEPWYDSQAQQAAETGDVRTMLLCAAFRGWEERWALSYDSLNASQTEEEDYYHKHVHGFVEELAREYAIAMEAASAGETAGLDGNRDSAGLKGIAQTQSDEGMQ